MQMKNDFDEAEEIILMHMKNNFDTTEKYMNDHDVNTTR